MTRDRLTVDAYADNVLSVSSTNTSHRREVRSAAVVWCGVLIALIIATSAISLAKRGLPLEGWSGTPTEQVVGWTLLAVPYVLGAWFPAALAVIVLTGVLSLSRRSWISISAALALALFGLFAAAA